LSESKQVNTEEFNKMHKKVILIICMFFMKIILKS